MNVALPVVFLLFGSLIFSGCAPLKNDHNYSQVHGDSGISGRSFDQIIDELKNLERSYQGTATVINYGRSLGGAPLTMIRIANPNVNVPVGTERPGIVIEGTIHGDEFLNIEDRLPRWFLENQRRPGVAKYLNSGGVIWIAPILNPDGYKAHRRENNRGKDLNRDFELKMAHKNGFTQPETKGLVEMMHKETASMKAKLNVTFDYHCCVGALIYPWGHSYTAELPPEEKKEHKRLAKMILEQFSGYGSGRAIEIVNYIAVGAADDFYHETFGAKSFTFEGAYRQEKNNFEKHTDMWERVMADQAGQQDLTQPGGNSGGTGQLPPTSGLPTVAIMGEDSQGRTIISVAGALDAAAMTLCKGDAASCSGSNPQTTVNYSDRIKIGDRLLFKTAEGVTITNGDVFTVLSKDSAGKILRMATVRLQKHS